MTVLENNPVLFLTLWGHAAWPSPFVPSEQYTEPWEQLCWFPPMEAVYKGRLVISSLPAGEGQCVFCGPGPPSC